VWQARWHPRARVRRFCSRPATTTTMEDEDEDDEVAPPTAKSRVINQQQAIDA